MARGPTPQVPAVRPARPPYIEAFEHFTTGKSDQIEALVAFGLFIKSDLEFASKQLTWPTEEKTSDYYGRLLSDSKNFEFAAQKVVDENREFLVREHQKRYLDSMFAQIDTGVQNLANRHSHKKFWRGVAEATTGAFCWMLICLAFIFGLWIFGVDIIHGIMKVEEKKASVSVPPPPKAAP